MTREQGEALVAYVDATADFIVATTVERPRIESPAADEAEHALATTRTAFLALLP